MDEFLGYFLKHVRGLGFATSVLATSLAWATFTPGKVSEDVTKTLAIWAGTYFFHRLGRILDKGIYDPLFSIDGSFARCLDKSRRDAEVQFDDLGWNIADPNTNRKALYTTSEIVFEDSGVWGEKVELWLELSKAARTFVLPLLTLFLWDRGRLPLPSDFRTSWLADPSVALFLFVLFLSLYLGLRVTHNRALYDLVGRAQINAGGFGMATIETRPKKPGEGKPSYRFYCEQVPTGARPQGAA